MHAASAAPAAARALRHRTAAGLALAAAPAAFVGAQLALARVRGAGPPLAVVAGQLAAWRVGNWLLLAWWVLALPAVLGLAHLLAGRAPGWADAGAALAVAGLLAGLGITVVDLVVGEIAALGTGGQLDRLLTALGTLTRPLDLVEDAFTLGLVLLALGLARARTAPRGAVALLLAGTAVPGVTTGLRILAGVLELAALGWIGARALAGGDRAWTDPPVGPPPRRPGLFAGVMTVLFLPGAALSGARFLAWVAVVLGLVVYRPAGGDRTGEGSPG